MNASIVDILKNRVNLLKSGKNYKCLCIFHSEKTPSMYVYPITNTFYCFGCHEFGGPVQALMKLDDITELQAKNHVNNVSHNNDEGIPTHQSEITIKTLKAMQFSNILLTHVNTAASKKAMKYLKDRKITQETILKFNIGILENDSSNDSGFFHKHRMFPDLEETLHLRDRNGTILTGFDKRVIFPVTDDNNIPVLFGGRSYNDDSPKYLYSKNRNDGHGKSHYLYNYSNCKRNLPIFVCEGPFDVWALYQNGVTNACAILGSSFSDNQIKILEEHPSSIYLCLDGDEAGKKGMIELLERSTIVRQKTLVITLDNEDPYDFYVLRGKNKIEEFSIDANTHMFNYFLSSLNLKLVSNRQELVQKVFKLIQESNMFFFEGFSLLEHYVSVPKDTLVKKYFKDFSDERDWLKNYLHNVFNKDLYYISIDNKAYIIKRIDQSPKSHIYIMRLDPVEFNNQIDLEVDDSSNQFDSGENVICFLGESLDEVYEKILKRETKDGD